MKATTTILIIAAVLSLQANRLFAHNDIHPVSGPADVSVSYCVSVMPSTPAEATFDDETVFTDLTALAPVAPKEASFDDNQAGTATVELAPVTPAEADFE